MPDATLCVLSGLQACAQIVGRIRRSRRIRQPRPKNNTEFTTMNAALWISKTGLSAQDAEMSAIANNIA
ncbi:hypothetical protein OIU10_28210, partial [Escherichia coli]|nr:hypothetical protein [Escherichia coli]